MSNIKGQSKVSTKAASSVVVVVDKPAATAAAVTQAPAAVKAVVDTHHEKLKATSDQIRLAQLLSGAEKADDAELTKKVDDVLAIVELVSRDAVVIALHECNYNVQEAIEYLFDHNNETQNEWTIVGQNTNTEKPGGGGKQERNKNDINNNTTHNHNENDKNNSRQRRNNNNNGNARGRGASAGGGRGRTNGAGGDTRIRSSKQPPQQQQQENVGVDNSNLVNNENGPTTTTTTTTVETNGHNHNGYGGRGGRGRGRGFGTRGGGRPRPQSQPQAQQQEQLAEQPLAEDADVNTNNNRQRNGGSNVNGRKRNNGDNMRDIGTWSNDQASRQNKPHGDEWDTQEEEWQGDLSKTQIFTSSSVLKQLESTQPAAAATVPPAAGEHQTKIDIDKLLHREEPRSFNTDFPIGHFNAEEASQQIKNAIGLKKVEAPPQQQQQAQQKPAITKLPSVKPPPPSTKIPKSAVIMPGDANTNSYRVDVEFGLDFGQDVDSNNTTVPLPTPVNKKDNVAHTTKQHQSTAPPPQQQQQQQQQIPAVANLLNDKRIHTVAPTQQQPLNVNKPPEAQRPQQPVAPLVQKQQTTEQLVNATKSLDLNTKQTFEQQHQQVTSKPPAPQQQQQQQQPFNTNQSNSNLIYNSSIQQQHAHQYKPQQPQQQKQMQFNNNNNSNDSYSSIPQRAVVDVNKDSHMNVSPLQKQQQPGPQMLNNQAKPATTAAASTATAAAATTMAPPPGVNMLNNQYLMSLPYHVFYEQNLPYFDQNQFEMIYNNPALSQLGPSQLPTSTVTQTAGNYTMSDTKMNRPDGLAGTTTTNAQQAQTQQQQQQQAINFIPNYPFFLQNMYPNMIVQFPNQPQTNPQFPNKPYNFNSYDEHGQSKDYQNYATQTQSGKSVNAAMPNLNDLNVNYAKQLDKQQTNAAAGYHTPPPNQSTYTNQLAAAVAGAGQPPYAYMQPQMMQPQPGGSQPLVLPPSMQDTRTNNIGLQQQQQQQQAKQQNKSVYPTNSNSWA